MTKDPPRPPTAATDEASERPETDDEIVPPGPGPLEELRDRVRVLEPGIVLLRQVPRPTPETTRELAVAVRELTRDWPSFVLVVDVSRTERPGPAVRREFARQIARNHNLDHLALFAEQNFLMQVTSRFLLRALGVRSSNVHVTFEEALDDARAHRS